MNNNRFILFFSLSISFALNSQIRCEIGVNPNDCTNCKPSYRLINYIDSTLNPKIYIGNVDERTANFFVRKYLNISNVPSEINVGKYEGLTSNMRPMVKVFDGDSLIMEFETRQLPDYIDRLNGLKNGKLRIFDISKSVIILNDTCFNNLLGYYRFRNFNNQLSIYTEVTKNLMTFDFNTGESNVFNLIDTFYFNQIRTKFKFSKQYIKNRNFYVKELKEQLPDGGLLDWLFLNNKLYLTFIVNKYDAMLSQKQLFNNNNEVKLSYNYYVGEFSILGNQIKLDNIKLFSESNFDEYKTDIKISILNNHPILLFKEKNDSIKMKAYMLDSGFKVFNYPIINTQFLHKQLYANTFINQFTTFNYNNYLFDQKKNKFVRLSSFTNDSIYNVDFIEHNDEVFILMNQFKRNMGYIYKVNFNTKSIETIRTYKNYESRTFDGCLVLDKEKNLLHVINMNNEKFKLLDSINLKTLISNKK